MRECMNKCVVGIPMQVCRIFVRQNNLIVHVVAELYEDSDNAFRTHRFS